MGTITNKLDADKRLEVQRETFVVSLGHDLKNPTIAQIRALELLLKGNFGEIKAEQKEIIEMILHSCKYMSAMLSSMLATYRTEKGAVKLNSEEFSLSDLAVECTEEMIYLAKDKDVSVSIKNDCSVETAYGDTVQIKRVIMNLLSNGIKYANKESSLKIKLFNENEMTGFMFENHSPYIPEDKRESIFAQYVSFAQAHNELGIGLGLYASKKIVEAHEGEIFVESFKDNRNIFGFKIPTKCTAVNKVRTVIF